MITKNAPILITGATGFVGSYVVRRLLAAGYNNLHATRRSGSRMDLLAGAEDQLQWHEAALDDYFSLEDATQGMHTVIHCAALVSFAPRDAQRLLDINRRGTKYMIDAAVHQQVSFFIQLSSVAALGRDPNGAPVTEKTKWEEGPLISNYSRSKFLAETEIWRGQAEGLRVASLYPTIVLGAGRWREGSVAMFDYASRGPKYYPGGSTGFVDVREVAEA
ncbi:MAG: NAD-dependent epimerase/dehydratase family protein, partial [Bacteroidota bacterium]